MPTPVHVLGRLGRKGRLSVFGAIATLAATMGIGVAVWSLLDAVLLHPINLPNSDRLVTVGSARADQRVIQPAHSYEWYLAIKESAAFEAVGASAMATMVVRTADARWSGSAAFTTHDFFRVVGASLQIGREFGPEDDRAGADPVVIVSDRFWRQQLQTAPDVLGKPLRISAFPTGGTMATIVGIMGPTFRGLSLIDMPGIYLPLHSMPVFDKNSNWFGEPGSGGGPRQWLDVVGLRSKDGNPTATQAQLESLSVASEPQRRRFELTDIQTASLPARLRPPLERLVEMLVWTAALLFAIGALTVGMLLILRTESRRPEFAVRVALGATPWRLAAIVIAEGVAIAAAGGLAALPVGWWILAALRGFELPGRIGVEQLNVGLDSRALLVVATATVAAAAIAASIAAFFAIRSQAIRSPFLRTAVGSGTGVRRIRFSLIVIQVASALVLLSGAGLFTRSLIAALKLNPGYQMANLASARVMLESPAAIRDPDATFSEIRDRVDRVPLIASTSLARGGNSIPRGGKLVVGGETRVVPSEVALEGVDEKYFSTIGLKLVSGRDFAASDNGIGPSVAIVSASLARLLAGTSSPLGYKLTTIGQPAQIAEVVGVVPDIITYVGATEPLTVYMPIGQWPKGTYSPSFRRVVIRAVDDSAAAIREATAAIRSIDPEVRPVFATIEQEILRQMGPQALGASVLTVFGGLTSLLVVGGIYVLVSSVMALRRRELGVRAALGASPLRLTRLLLFEVMKPVIVGVTIGLFGVWSTTALVRGLLFQIEPIDITTLITVLATIGLLCLAVAMAPALRLRTMNLARTLSEE